MSMPVMDEAAALYRALDDRELLGTMIEAFAEEKQIALAGIDAARVARDGAKLQYFAHRLKGGVSTIGGMEVWEIACGIEEKAKAGNWDGMDEAIEALLAALERLQPELERVAASS